MRERIFDVLVAVGIAMFLTLAIPTVASAQGFELNDPVVLSAEVVGIDKVDRTLTLRSAKGNIVKIEVGQGARNFDQIGIGDQVKVEYYQSLAVYVGPRGLAPETSVGLVAARSPKGDKPGGMEIESIDVTATVQAIDLENRTVTLKLPDETSLVTEVDKSVEGLETLKVGDSIHARYTEALAVSVEKL